MDKKIKIRNGEYSGKLINNVVFDYVEDMKIGKQGPYIKVNGRNIPGYPSRNFKIFISNEDDYTVFEQDLNTKEVDEKVNWTDEEIIAYQDQMFKDLSDLTDAARTGSIRSMIVSGDAGLGKSYTVEETLAKASQMFDSIADRKQSFEILKGDISPVNLYCKLYNYSKRGQCIVLDDCDEILFDTSALNMLKAVLDTSPKRRVSYYKDSLVLRDQHVPNTFEYFGSMIFITNLDFEEKIVRGTKNSAHYAALMSRSHYVNVHLRTKRERWLRMKSVVEKGMLNEFNLDANEQQEVMDFIKENFHNLREISLRTVIKVAQLRATTTDRWKTLATTSVLKK